MDSEFLKRVNENPEIINITRQRNLNGLIIFSENITLNFIDSLIWVYQNYFLKEVKIFTSEYHVFPDSVICNLEILEKYVPSKNEIIMFIFADFIFKDFNKKRLNTLIKNFSKKNKIIILSSCSLKCIDLSFLELFEFYKLPEQIIGYHNLLNTLSLFDLTDPYPDVYTNNLESFTEMVMDLVLENKKIYISLNLPLNKLIEIETIFKNKDVSISRKEDSNCNIIINSYKTTEKTFLKNKYSVYIFSPPIFEEPLEVISLFKDVFKDTDDIEIFMDSSKNRNIEKCLKMICGDYSIEKRIIKDSIDFNSFEEIKIEDEIILASESYFLFNSPESILKMNLSSLTKKEYDIIREFVKTKLNIKYDIEIRTCQLSAPCSPKDRSKKLNSLSNKISSFNYRCDCTCEIFKDYSIGVIIWNELFSNRKTLPCLKNNTYAYQTTYGKWKYTSVK